MTYNYSTIINRIECLINLAADGSNEHESANAAQKAIAVMERYEIRPAALNYKAAQKYWQHVYRFTTQQQAAQAENIKETPKTEQAAPKKARKASSKKQEEPKTEEPKSHFSYRYDAASGKYFIYENDTIYAPKGRKWYSNSANGAEKYVKQLTKQFA